jgi:hypothetical protein
MKTFEVGELIVEGWAIGLDREVCGAFIEVGRDPQEYDAGLFLPFSKKLSALILEGESALSPEVLARTALYQAAVAREDGELCIAQATGVDRTALVKVGIAHGVGGKIEYFFESSVDVIAHGVIGAEEERFPIYVLVMSEGSSFHVHRTGDLCGLPAEMSFTWDGEKLVQKSEE